MKAMYEILFNNMSLPYPHHLANILRAKAI